MMFDIIFYEDTSGKSELWDFLEELRILAETNKDSRIQYKQILLQIELLRKLGTRQPVDNVKHIQEDIWELRPGKNRVFFFHFKDGVFVLLHHYRKESQKTPKREIERAISERDDYISRMKGR